jgi:hypothetical protein
MANGRLLCAYGIYVLGAIFWRYILVALVGMHHNDALCFQGHECIQCCILVAVCV